jgi:hypothetical protein
MSWVINANRIDAVSQRDMRAMPKETDAVALARRIER